MGKSVSSGLLKATLAKALNNLPERKVDYPHRVVQEHGEVSRGKRGRGGAGVTPRDAAMTIIAVASSFIGDEIIRRARDFAAIPLSHTAKFRDGVYDGIENTRWQFEGFSLPHLQNLPAGHSFVDALTAIIEAARDKAFEGAIREAKPNDDPLHDIRIVFHGPEPAASIEIELLSDNWRYREEAGYFFEERTATPDEASAFAVDVTINYQAIYAVAKLFRAEEAE